MLLGPFYADVELMTITFPSEVLSVDGCNARGFNVMEHMSNGSSKVFTLEVPFTDRVVLQRVSFTQLGKLNIVVWLLISLSISQQSEMGMIVYSLHLTFDLLVLPEFAKFSQTAYLEAKLVDIGMYS